MVEIPKTRTLKELWNTYTQQKTDVKESTLDQYGNVKERFFGFFEESEELSELTQQRMQQWEDSLREKLAEATIAGTIAKTKAVFNWAVQVGWIEKSPLDGVRKGSFINRSKDRIVTMDEYGRLLNACPCKDWRVIIALARIGGLRCPSEMIALRWEDVNWEEGRFYVTSSKTEHHAGKEGREYVINRYRNPKQNLGTPFEKIVKQAGLPRSQDRSTICG